MIKQSKKDKIILIIYIIITILFFILYGIFHGENNIKTEKEISEISESMKEETSVKYYLTIEPGEYFDILSKNTTLRVEFVKGIYIFEVHVNNGENGMSIYRFSGKYDKKINGIHYNDLIYFLEPYDEKNGNENQAIMYEGGKGEIIVDGNRLCWNDENEEKKYDEKYNAIFEMPRNDG